MIKNILYFLKTGTLKYRLSVLIVCTDIFFQTFVELSHRSYSSLHLLLIPLKSWHLKTILSTVLLCKRVPGTNFFIGCLCSWSLLPNILIDEHYQHIQKLLWQYAVITFQNISHNRNHQTRPLLYWPDMFSSLYLEYKIRVQMGIYLLGQTN